MWYTFDMSKLMDHIIDRLRQLPDAEQDQIASEVEELLEEFPTQLHRDLRSELKE
jgi:hypothetical protein